MDSRRNKEKRRTAKIPASKRGRENSSVEVKESREFAKSHDEKKSNTCGEIKKNAQTKVKKIFEPVKEQLQMLVHYVEILETRKDTDDLNKICQLSEFMRMVVKNCEVYLNCQLLKAV